MTEGKSEVTARETMRDVISEAMDTCWILSAATYAMSYAIQAYPYDERTNEATDVLYGVKSMLEMARNRLMAAADNGNGALLVMGREAERKPCAQDGPYVR